MSLVMENQQVEVALRSKVKELEGVIADLTAQNEILMKENGKLTSRLLEFENTVQKKGAHEEVRGSAFSLGLASPRLCISAVDAAQHVGGVNRLDCQVENSVLDGTSACPDNRISEQKGRRNKKKKRCRLLWRRAGFFTMKGGVLILDTNRRFKKDSKPQSVRTRKDAMAKDMSHYPTRHVALKLMYLGTRYHGFASQAGTQKTVETEFLAALHRTRLITGTLAEAKYSRCGRTDKGVSAIGQVIALYLRSKVKFLHQEKDVFTEDDENFSTPECSISTHCDSEGEEHSWIALNRLNLNGDRVALARASRSQEWQFAKTASYDDEFDYVGMLNRALPEDIRVLGWCPVPPGFSARFSCLHREYKYFFINKDLDIDAMKSACKTFEGEHDFSNFCKTDAANVHNYTRTITSFDIQPSNEEWGGKPVWMMSVRGTAFLWHQVRCMVAVLFMVGYGCESPKLIEEMLDLRKFVRKPQYIMAAETPLLLYQCGYQGLAFQCHPDSVKRLRLHLESLLQSSIVNSSLLLQGLMELPSLAEESTQLRELQSKRSAHVPLIKRPTQPTYAERIRMQHGGQVETSL